MEGLTHLEVSLLAHRAISAAVSKEPFYVSPDEYRLLRDVVQEAPGYWESTLTVIAEQRNFHLPHTGDPVLVVVKHPEQNRLLPLEFA